MSDRGLSPAVVPLYDSAARRSPRGALLEAWQERELVRMLVYRKLVLRYKRSVLGAGWTLVNPLLEMGALAVVFAARFRGAASVTFVVYLMSGIVLLSLLRETVVGVTTVLRNDADVIGKVYVPTGILALSTAITTTINFLLTMVPLLLIMLVTGTALKLTTPLIVVPAALLVVFAAGIGMALAPSAVRYPDIAELTRVALLITGYMAPVFYPLSIVPHRLRFLVELNPLTHALAPFRQLLYGGTLGSWHPYAELAGYAAVSVGVGGWIFTRSARDAIAQL